MPVVAIVDRSIALYNAALETARAGDWERALRLVDGAIELVATRAEYHLLRGKINAHRAGYAEAAADWRRAARLDPESDAAGLASMLERLARAVRDEAV